MEPNVPTSTDPKLLADAKPYGERYAELRRQEGDNVGPTFAYQTTVTIAATAQMRGTSVEEEVARSWPELRFVRPLTPAMREEAVKAAA